MDRFSKIKKAEDHMVRSLGKIMFEKRSIIYITSSLYFITKFLLRIPYINIYINYDFAKTFIVYMLIVLVVRFNENKLYIAGISLLIFLAACGLINRWVLLTEYLGVLIFMILTTATIKSLLTLQK